MPAPISFFFNDTATTEIYTLSLHDALPISEYGTANGRLHFHAVHFMRTLPTGSVDPKVHRMEMKDRKSGSAGMPRPISYAVFCLQKKKHPPHFLPLPSLHATRLILPSRRVR